MLWVYFVFLIVAAIALLFASLWFFEIGVSFLIVHNAAELPSQNKMRAAVARVISDEIPRPDRGMTIIDIGAGYGGMVRYLARRFPCAHVSGIERMPIAFMFGRILSLFAPKNARTHLGDFNKFIRGKKFDIAVCYLGTEVMACVGKLSSHFGAIVSVDFPIPGRQAAQVIDLHRDALGEHRIYIYK